MAHCPNCRNEVLWTPCHRCGTPWQPAHIEATNIPGLYNIRLADGRVLTDVVEANVERIIHELGLVPA